MNRYIRAIAAAAFLCASLSSIAAIQSSVEDVTVTLKRASNNVTAAELADVCATLPGCSLPLTEENCPAIKSALITKDAPTKTIGGNVYQCLIAQRSMVTFRANPPPCGPKPADEQQRLTCPAPTVGTWLQDRVYTLQPAPTCWVLGEWAPAAPPEGMCAPPVPTTLPAPIGVTAAGISTSSIRVTWNAVTDAAAYSFERCIGATCTTFSQLLCVQTPSGTHTSLPASTTARYRVRASRDAACGTDINNLGAYSAIVSGTTLGNAPAPVDCAVSAWSSWNGGAWSACSNGAQSRTETRTRAVTTQPTNGGTACPVLAETRTTRQPCAAISWVPPTQNTDGSTLTNLAGYRIHYGRSATALAQTIQVPNGGASGYTVAGLEPGTYFFAIRAYTSSGAESEPSNIVTMTAQ